VYTGPPLPVVIPFRLVKCMQCTKLQRKRGVGWGGGLGEAEEELASASRGRPLVIRSLRRSFKQGRLLTRRTPEEFAGSLWCGNENDIFWSVWLSGGLLASRL